MASPVAAAMAKAQELLSLRISRAAKNLHHSLVHSGLVGDIKIDAFSAPCVKEGGVMKRMLYGMNHLPPAVVMNPPPQAPVPSVPPATAPPSTPVVVPAPASPPMSMSASPPEVVSVGGMAPSVMPPPCLAPPAAAMSPPPWSGEGGSHSGLWCVAKPTVPEDKLQD
ncbi:hypothetical protein ABZP36_028483 [Zizania latifolia]